MEQNLFYFFKILLSLFERISRKLEGKEIKKRDGGRTCNKGSLFSVHKELDKMCEMTLSEIH